MTKKIQNDIRMTFEEWVEKFKPIKNHTDEEANIDGTLFEIDRFDFLFIKEYDRSKVWTYIEGDDGNYYVSEGIHMVNRMGYFITEIPYEENTFYEILDEIDFS